MRLEAQPEAGQTQERSAVVSKAYPAGGLFQPYAVEVTLSNPYTFRATALANVTGLLAAIALFALGLSVVVSAAMARRFTTPLRRLTEASRGLAEGDLSRRVPAEPGPRRLVRAGRAGRPVQRDGRSPRGERGDHPPRSRPEPRLPGGRLARAANAARRAAHVQRAARARVLTPTRRRGPSSSSRAASRSSGSTGWPRTCSSSRSSTSGLVLLDLRPDDLRAAVESAVEQSTAAARKRGIELVAAPAVVAGPDPARPAADRPGRGQPRRERGQVHGARRVGRGRRRRDAGRRADRRRRHRGRHRDGRAAVHLRPVLSRLAGPTRRVAAAAASGWRSPARSWTCTAVGSRSRAAWDRDRGSASRCRAIHG